MYENMSDSCFGFLLVGSLSFALSLPITVPVGLEVCHNGFGVRGIKTDYTFQYKGKPARIEHEDVIVGDDRYYLVLDDKPTKDLTQIISDDSKLIELESGGHGYTIRDSK